MIVLYLLYICIIMNMNPLLSIITPVYNVVSFLDRCIKSILSQSYRNIELILIDDGSTDGSSLLCDEWAAKDSRVMVIHKENGGVSSARNSGLKVFKGEYLTFVDPDDFIASDTYAVNMDYLLAHCDVDVLQYPYCHYLSDEEISNYHQPAETTFIGSEQIFRNWWSGTPLEYVIWNKIYKRNIWENVSFEFGRTSEDTCLVAHFVEKANAVYISEHGLYYYQRDRVDSYTYKYNFNKHMDLFHAHSVIYRCFDKFPDLVTEKVLAFTRLYRRLITAKETDTSADIRVPLSFISQNFPTWHEIMVSRHTEKLWLSIAKLLGANLFVKLFLRYLRL